MTYTHLRPPPRQAAAVSSFNLQLSLSGARTALLRRGWLPSPARQRLCRRQRRRTFPCSLPGGIVGNRDAKPVRRQLRYHWTVAACEDAAAGALAEAIQATPIQKHQDLVGVVRREWLSVESAMVPRRLLLAPLNSENAHDAKTQMTAPLGHPRPEITTAAAESSAAGVCTSLSSRF